MDATVLILGSGFSGLAMAARLQQDGVSFLVLERASTVGGTWRDNVYPGCACDVASHLYSLSFALNPDWTSAYARQPEIRAYLEGLVDERALRPHIVFGAEVRAAVFSEGWTLRCADGRVFRGRFVVNGVGALRDPSIPSVPNAFQGPQMHSARWDASVSLEGKRVVVIGTGASAVQIVPAIQGQVGSMAVVQRTPPWIVPRRDTRYSDLTRWCFRHVPGLGRLWRWMMWLNHEVRYPLFFGGGALQGLAKRALRWHLRSAVADPALRVRVTPDYRIGCKRVLVAEGWYEALQQPHVSLCSGSVASLEEDAVVLEDGTRLEADVVIWCTGFRVDDPLGAMTVAGVDGVDLKGWWGSRPRAYLGIAVPHFPDAFILLGPNTALGHSSVLLMIEAQVRWIRQAIAWSLETDRPVEVSEDRLVDFLGEMDGRHQDQVWMSGCRSWYLNAEGENYTIWPGGTWDYTLRTWSFDPSVCVEEARDAPG